ncbi:MAG TPA: hypothetical protein VF058_02660 [Actinomycetota bacterium]
MVRRAGAAVLLGILVAIPVAAVGWTWLATPDHVAEVRALEDRAIAYMERFRAPELEFRGTYDRVPESDVRLVTALRRLPGGELLAFAMWGDSGPPWEPGYGVWVRARYRSSLSERETCHLLASTAGVPRSECVAGEGDPLVPDERPYTLSLRGEGLEGSAEVYRRRLRDANGDLEPEFSVVADIVMRACGTERFPGIGSCP